MKCTSCPSGRRGGALFTAVAAMAECKERGGEALIVGGGYIGMECAAAVANNGIKTTMVFPEDRMMSRLFSRDMADFYEGVYATK